MRNYLSTLKKTGVTVTVMPGDDVIVEPVELVSDATVRLVRKYWMDIVQEVLSGEAPHSLMRCPECAGELHLKRQIGDRGLADIELEFRCACGFDHVMAWADLVDWSEMLALTAAKLR